MGRLHGPRVFLAVVRKELAESLRDVHVLVFSFGLPLVFYPLLIWGGMQIVMLEHGLGERAPPRVAVEGPADLRAAVLAPPVVEISLGDSLPPDPVATRKALEDDVVDVVVRGSPSPETTDGLHVRVEHLSTRPSSARALSDTQDRLEALSLQRREGLAASRGLDVEALDPWLVVTEDLAPAGQTLAMVMSLVVPAILLMNMLMAGVYPTVEAVVGERERGTLETTMVAAIPRATVVGAKVVGIVLILLVSTAANVLGVLLTLFDLQARIDPEGAAPLAYDLSDLAMAFAVTTATAVLIAAILTLAALPARNFKEGQNLVSMASIVGMVAATAGFLPLVELSPTTAAIPLVNTVLVLRDAISAGPLSHGAAAMAFVVNLLAAAAFLRLGAGVVSSEGYQFGNRLPPWLAFLRGSR